MKIAIGSLNRAKKLALEKAVEAAGLQAEIESVSVPSNVSEQPFSDEETRQGAVNRAKNTLTEANADIGIGLEGGVMETDAGLFLCNWGALAVKEQVIITAGGARILLPPTIAEQLRSGEELGPVMERFTARAEIRQHEGAIGVFTNGLVTRDEMFLHVAKLLLGQFLLINKK
ncbi:DUF84 family protein [Pseudobacillus wudalianchiensis]|uniref:Probable inosine/xanthosine triphosphatase n=1 Tax=Pseudobacillus wudalianchiensis TaxID=1743143 RepID=A0A1B9B7Y4_9BACI|nr:DUF84 family protein [Bacillus wudalianchiensis]OCA92215.1 inosine/xanthosine triphosphatase [Bacillus wudalianchiensis]